MRHRLVFAGPLLFMGALLVHCSGGSFATGSDGGSDASVRDPQCPSTEPTSGTPCNLANGTTCSNYPSAAAGCYCCSGGGSSSLECSNGKWVSRVSGGGGGPPSGGVACPVTVPKQGDSCAPGCGGAQQVCSYDCAHGNGSVSTADCQGGSWQIRQSAVACEAADGGSDAGDSGDADAHD